MDVPERYIIPYSVESVFNWGLVVAHPNSEDYPHSFIIAHSLPGPNTTDEEDCDEYTEVQFHLQGFVSKANLSPLGTWQKRWVTQYTEEGQLLYRCAL